MALLKNLADSELRVLFWNGTAGVLFISVTKELGAEIGVMKFDGVSHVNLPPRLGTSGIDFGSLDDLPKNFIEIYRPGDQGLEAEDNAYLIHGSWGEEYFVIAEGIEYERYS